MIEIKKFQIDYLEQILTIEKDCQVKPWTKDMFLSSFKNDNVHFVVCLEDKKIIGYCLFSIIADECEILNIVIAKNKRRLGFGKNLLQYAIKIAKESKVKTIFLEVRQSNKPAISLYLSNDFKQYLIRKNYYGNEDAKLLRKII